MIGYESLADFNQQVFIKHLLCLTLGHCLHGSVHD